MVLQHGRDVVRQIPRYNPPFQSASRINSCHIDYCSIVYSSWKRRSLSRHIATTSPTRPFDNVDLLLDTILVTY